MRATRVARTVGERRANPHPELRKRCAENQDAYHQATGRLEHMDRPCALQATSRLEARSIGLIGCLGVSYSQLMMYRLTGNVLLVVTVLALVTAPVRYAYAMAVLSCSEEASHCDGMQHALHAKTPMVGNTDQSADGKKHCSGHGCDGTCCNGACLHLPVALTGAVSRDLEASTDGLRVRITLRWAGDAISPLFRPPISLLS